MSPAKKGRHRDKSRGADSIQSVATRWSLAFYRTAKDSVPAREFLLACPQSVREMLLAIVVAVRDAPPPSKMWHAMHGEMRGFHEARDEHDGRLYRVFCVLDSQALECGLDAKALTLICGGAKQVRSPMDKRVYKHALACREDYFATRRIVLPVGVPNDQGGT